MRGFSLAVGLIGSFTNSLFPSECPLCRTRTDNLRYAPFCMQCWISIRKYSGPACRVCGVPFSSPHASICSDCMKRRPAFSRAVCYGLYEGGLASAIQIYKFQGIRRLSGPLGSFLLGFDLDGIDAIVPVPLSKKGLRERGFNQSLLLARKVSKGSGIPLFTDSLKKKADTLPQIGLSARERRRNLKGVFEAAGDFRGMHLLLIDDVMTTGATANECSIELRKAGARELTVLTLARAGIL